MAGYTVSSFADTRFRHLGPENGLSGERVAALLQDREGYMWFATDNGLDRYDGFTFQVFKHNAADPDSLSADFARTLYEDPKRRLWVGTYGGGLDLYDPDSGKFIHYLQKRSDNNGIATDKIWSLAGGPNGTLIIGTYDAGVYLFDPESKKARQFTTANSPGLSSNRINAIFTDSGNETWLATDNGLDKFDPLNGNFTTYLNPNGVRESNFILSISEDTHHRLWLATKDGMHFFLSSNATFLPGNTLAEFPDRVPNVILDNILTDSLGNVWMGSEYSGLYLFQNDESVIKHIHQEPGNPESLSSNTIWQIYEDRSGLIWIATDGGVNVLDSRLLDIKYVSPFSIEGTLPSASNKTQGILERNGALLIGSTAGIYSIPLGDAGNKKPPTLYARIDTTKYGNISALYDLGDHGILAGTARGYLLTVDAHGRITRAQIVGQDIKIPNHPIHQIIQLDGKAFYLATFGNGLLKYDSYNSTTQSIVATEPSGLLRNDIAEILLQVSPEVLWVGTFRGLFALNIHSGKSSLVSLMRSTEEPVIQSLYADGHGNIWVGTYDGPWKLALNKHGVVTKKSYFGDIAGLGNAPTLSIESDRQGNLWIAQINALVRFNPASHETLTLGRDQGLAPMEYYSYTHAHTSDNWLWFGGAQGIVGFDPTHIQPNLHPPNVVITGTTIYGKNKRVSTHPHPGVPLQLHYQDSIATFDLAAMDFASPQANTYSYRLAGIQSEWTAPSSTHQITLNNLSPGHYHMEVRAANNWGTWSETPTSLDIVVFPPWWRTWWAYTLYLLFIVSSVIAYVYNLKRKIVREKEISASLREANEIKTHFMEQLESQVKKATYDLRETLQGVNLKNAELEIAQKRASEGEKIKSQFLANMSHELRTPLTGVLGYTKLLADTRLSSEQKDYIGTIRQSSETLLAIINDTLDLSRLEAGKLLIDEVDFDVLEIIESTLELLAPIAYQKRLDLIRIVVPDVPLQLRGDPLRLRQVLTNLLSNAIKFTEYGSVCLQVRAENRDERGATLVITVSDTGIGIPENDLPKLFNVYARGRISARHQVEGTGLGLAICKKLLDLMGGEIHVTSRLGGGTSIAFKLPLKLQKNPEPSRKLAGHPRVLLYDTQPSSNEAWRASLTRMGAVVKSATDLQQAVSIDADAALVSLTEMELLQVSELQSKFLSKLPPMLVLAPRMERQALNHLSETLFHRVLSKAARERTVQLELQSLLQVAIPPVATALVAPKPAAAPDETSPLILVADDNRINRRLLVTMLNQAGFRAAEAANGIELVQIAEALHWDAAILDIHMPGMDGIEAAERVRTRMGDATPPIIAMSADAMPETREHVLKGTMDDFLVKPFTEQQLVDKLHWHLERRARHNHETALNA